MSSSHRYPSARRAAVLGICALALIVLPGTSVWATARSIGARTIAFVGRTVAPAFGLPAAAVPPPPAIGATMTTSIATDGDSDGKADPGDVIRYTTTITNSGSDATGVHLNDLVPNGTTLVPGSTVVSPIARGETYQSVGNMTLTTEAIASDCDVDPLVSIICNDALHGATLTAFGDTQAHAGDIIVDGTHTVATANGGVATLNTNGTFVYDPAAGFNGTDTFWYTITNAATSDTAQVSIVVGGPNRTAWFVAPGGSGSGKQTSPIGMAAFQAKNTLPSPTATDPRDGDTVFLLAGSHPGPLTLRASQALIGQEGPAGSTVNVGGIEGVPPQPGNAYSVNPGGTVSISGGVVDVTLNANNVIANFTAGSASSVAITGGAVGALKVSRVSITNPSGGGLAITTSGTLINTPQFNGFLDMSTGGGSYGVTLTGVDGVIELGNGLLSGSTVATFNVVGGTVTTRYFGRLAQLNNAPVVSVSGGHSGGTIRFHQGGEVIAHAGPGMVFDNADGIYNFIGTTEMRSTVTGGISITNGSSGEFNFGGVGPTNIFNPTGVAFNLANSDARVIYGGSITKSTAGPAISIDNHGVQAIAFSQGTLTSDGASSGIVVKNCHSGAIVFGFGQKILNTGANTAVNLDTNNSGCEVDFAGGGLAINTTSGTGFSATGGGTVMVIPGNPNNPDTITTETGTALHVSNTAIRFDGMTFRSISAGTASAGPTNAIIFDHTSGPGLTVTGTGTTPGSGGTIQNTVQGAVFTSTNNVSLANMIFMNANSGNGTVGEFDDPAFNSAAQAAINLTDVSTASFTNLVLDGGGGAGGAQVGVNGQNVSNLTIANTTVTGFGDAVGEGAVKLWNLTGNSAVTNSTFSFASGDSSAGENLFEVRNDTGTLALTVTGSTFKDTRSSTFGSGGLALRSIAGAAISLTASNNDFLNLKTSGVEALAGGLSTMNVDLIDGNVFDPQGGAGRAIGLTARNTAQLNFNINRNEKIYGSGGAIVSVEGANAAVISGRIDNNPDIQGGGAGALGPAIYLNAAGNSTATVEVLGNAITGTGQDPAIVAGSRGDLASAFSAALDVTVSGNSITLSGTGVPGSGTYGIATFAGASAGDATRTCVSLQNNTVTPSAPIDKAWLLQNAGTSNLYVEGWDGTSATTWNARGNTPASSTVEVTDPGAPPIAAPPGGTCLTTSHTTARLNVAPSPVWASAAGAGAPAVPAMPGRGPAINPAGLRNLVERVASASSALRMPALHALRTRLEGAWSAARDLLWRSAASAKSAALGVMALAREAANGLVATVVASGETVDVDLGVVPAGKSVTVVFDVTVDTPPVASYGNHATIVSTDGSFPSVDSNTATTSGDRYDTTTTVISSLNPSEEHSDVIFTATVEPAEGTDLTPDGTVQFKDGGSPIGSPVTCADAGGYTCTAELTTSSLPGGTRSITADYLGGTHHDPSSSNTLSQDNAACTSNPTVTIRGDSGPGSLRQAIADACGNDGHNVISFHFSVAPGIELTSGPLELTRNVNISGNGAANLLIARAEAASQFRLIHVNSDLVVNISDLTLFGGWAAGPGVASYGGAILNERSSLFLSRVAIRDNYANHTGGGIASLADGGQAHLFIADSAVFGNGALSTLGAAGGIDVSAQAGGFATLTLVNSTVSGNSGALGAGVAVGPGARAVITNATIAANQSITFPRRGALSIDSTATVFLRNTIVADNVTLGNQADVEGAVDGSSSHNLIGVDHLMTGIVHGTNGNQVGTPASPIDPRLGPFSHFVNNGGLMPTHALLTGSPAIDAGNNARVASPPFVNASPFTDSRGTGFVRIADGADGDTTATVDIGAFEAQTTIEDIVDQATLEDTPLAVSFNVGDAQNVGFDSITATSSDAALVSAGNLVITGTGSTRTLTITPAANASGTATITVTVSKTIGGAPQDAVDTFVLTVTPVNDRPTLDPIGSPGIPEDSALVTFELPGISSGAADESQTLTVTATSDNQALVPDPIVTYASPDTAATLQFTPIANAVGTATITVTVHDDGGTANGGFDTIARQFTVSVSSVADTPSVTGTTTAEETLSTGGLVVTKNPADDAAVTHVKITNIQHGSLFKSDGVTGVADGQFLTFAEAGAGLRFRGAVDFFGTASFDVQGSTAGSNSGLGGGIATAAITITPVAETPQVTGATTLAQVQTTSGLVITPDPTDVVSVTHYKITSISGGTPYKNDGSSVIAEGGFITVADGAAGLRFTPAAGFTGTATFAVQGASDNLGAGLGTAATASIVVDKHATTTSVVSADPNPSDKMQPIDVHYTVTSADGGPAPAGTVTVTMSGSLETCTGTVAAGRCTLTSTTAGTRTIDATYNGDAMNLGSAGAISHTFSECSLNPIVQSGADSGPDTLREAVANACYGGTIQFGIGETITLSSPIDVLKTLTITGHGGIRLSGGNVSRVIHVGSGATVTLDRLTIADGAAGFGAGIHNQGDLTVTNSTIAGNTAGDSGGGLWNDNGQVAIVNSTISGNTAVAQWGGGIYSTGPAGVVHLTHVTITGNTAGAEHGGVRLQAGTIGNSIVAGNTAPLTPDGSFTSGVTVLGANLLAGDPKLGPLQDNGGPTFTHMPLPGSPVLDAGDNAVVTDAGLTTDQRGAPYARVLDAADADTTQTADLGAVEADPILSVIPDQTFDEGGSAQVTFNVGDPTTPFDFILAFSDNGALLFPDPVDLTSGGSTRTLTLAPGPDAFGVAHVTVRARKRISGGPYQNTETTFTVAVNGINDPPTLDPIAGVTSPEDLSSSVPLAGISFGPGEFPDPFVPMTMTATSSNTALIPNLVQNLSVSFNGAGPFGNVFYRPVANKSGTTTITVTLTDPEGATLVRTFTITVTTVPERPVVSQTFAREDTPSFPFTITRDSRDGAEVTHFKLTNVTGGTLALFDQALTPVASGQFITLAQGAASLVFVPSPNSTLTGHFTVQASLSASDAGLGGPTVIGNVPIDSIPDPPIVTGATTLEDTQSTSGLVVIRNPVDGPDVTLFRVLQANNGTLFLPGSTAPISGADLITIAQGAAGLRFTPFPNFTGAAAIVIVGIVDSPFIGLVEGEPGIATVTVTPVPDTPSITGASTTVNAQTAAGLVVSRSPFDNSEVTHVKVTGVSGGQLFQHDGVTPIGVGSFITMAQGAAGLRFTPATDSVAAGQVTIQASTSGNDAGLGGGTATAAVVIAPAASTTTVVTSKSPSDPGELVTFTATVTAPVGTLTGTVQFKADFVAMGVPVPLVNGSASISTSTLPPGQTEIQAVYSGDALAAASSGFLTGTQRVRAPVTMAIISSRNPAPLGSRVTITAVPRYAVDEFTGPVDGGTVTFKEGATTLGVVAVTDGSSSLITSSLTLGPHHLSVEYGGTPVFMPATGTFDQITSCPVMVILPSLIRPAVLGLPYTETFTQGGGVGTITFSLTGALPAGLSFDAATATLSGVPLTPGSYPIQVTATPAYACAAVTESYTLTAMSGRSVLTGADAGGSPHVRRFTALDGGVPRTGVLTSFLAFDPLFNSGVRVAEGDVNGDGEPDYIFGAGAGGAPEVRIVDGATGALRASLVAFEPEFRGGVFVAAGDVNGDGFVDVIAGSGEGRPGEVKVFSGRDLSVLADTFVFDRAFTGGVRVAAGDVNGDGFADLVVGTGEGAATVTVLSGTDLSALRTLTAYAGFSGGVFVAAGDVTGDGYADIVTGAGAGGGPHVKVFDGRTGAETHGFFALDPSFTGGVRVAAGDVNGDGHAEIIVGAGPGGAPEVRVFDPVTSTLLNTVLAYAPGFTGGVFVATAVPVSQMVIDTPAPNATVRSAFTLSGWAFEDGNGTAGIAGIAGIVVLAVPVDGSEPIAVGAATMGDLRPDVAAIYGGQYANAGFHMAVSGLPPGVYDLHVLARGGVSRVTNMRRIVRITIAPDPQPILAIDIPATGRLSSGDFVVGGWALTLDTSPAPGVDAVHVWAAPVGGGAWHFVGAAVLGLPRPDVAIAFGSQYAAAGYSLNVTGLAPGTWDLLVFPRRTGTAAFAAPRVVRVTVPGGSTRSIITGADAGGGPHVKRFDALDGGVPAVGALSSFFAFDGSFTGGVRVAEGDVTGDGVPDYVAAAGPGGAPEVRIIDGALGSIRASFLAFEPGFRGGVFVAAADVNGDGLVDVIAGSGEGRRGEIKVFSGRDLTVLRDVFVFDASFRGGVHVAAGDVNADGYADLVAGAGAGGTEVLVLNATDLSMLWTVTPYAGFLGGAWVAAGDVTGDGFADVITGAGAGGGPHVRVYDGRTGTEVRNFFAYEGEFAGGVRVAVGDVTGDGRGEIITGPGLGRAAEARVFDATTAALLSNVLAYPGFTSGVFVATAVPVNRMAIDTPADGATIHGAFSIVGWAFDEHPSTAGLDAIHVWAFPVAGGVPTFGGVAALGIPRPDVAALYGAQYANAGFSVDIADLAPGVYDVVVFGHSAVSGTFNLQRVVRITVTP